MTTTQEHEHYQAVAEAKQQVVHLVHRGITRKELEAAIAPLLTGLGKLARRNVRAEAAKIAKLSVQTAQNPCHNGALIRSHRGTWGMEISGNRVAALTRDECLARRIEPGPGND